MLSVTVCVRPDVLTIDLVSRDAIFEQTAPYTEGFRKEASRR